MVGIAVGVCFMEGLHLKDKAQQITACVTSEYVDITRYVTPDSRGLDRVRLFRGDCITGLVRLDRITKGEEKELMGERCVHIWSCGYYPDYAVKAQINSSATSFFCNSQVTRYNGLTYAFDDKYSGEKISLNLSSDTLNGYDTTYFGVHYYANNELVKFDTGYSTKGNTFVTFWDVK